MIRINDIHSIPLVAKLADVSYVAGSDVCIAHYDHADRLTSGVLFTGGNEFSSEIHIASFKPNWGSKELLYFTFFYAFKFRSWRKLFGRVPEHNEAAFKLDLKLGFRIEAYLRDVYGPGSNMFILSMYDFQCRFLDMKPPKILFPNQDQASIIIPDATYSLELH